MWRVVIGVLLGMALIAGAAAAENSEPAAQPKCLKAEINPGHGSRLVHRPARRSRRAAAARGRVALQAGRYSGPVELWARLRAGAGRNVKAANLLSLQPSLSRAVFGALMLVLTLYTHHLY